MLLLHTRDYKLTLFSFCFSGEHPGRDEADPGLSLALSGTNRLLSQFPNELALFLERFLYTSNCYI